MSVGVNSAPCSVTRTARGPRSSCPLTERVAERVPTPCRLLFPRRRFPSVPVCRLQTRCSQPTGRRRRDRTASPDAAPALLCPTRPGPECPAPPGARPCGARLWPRLALCPRAVPPQPRLPEGPQPPSVVQVGRWQRLVSWVFASQQSTRRVRVGPPSRPQAPSPHGRSLRHVCHPEGDSGLSEQRKPWVIDVTSDMASLRLSVTLAGEAT